MISVLKLLSYKSYKRFILVLWLGLMAVANTSFAETQAGSSLTTSGQYRLSAGDELEVFVWREEELSKPVTISPDGSLSYPLAGAVQAAGLTLTELQAKLTSRIRQYIPKALVTVTLVEVNGYRIYVLGEVNKPGEYIPGNYVTIAQALTLAEGLTSFAKASKIRVVRQIDGKEEFLKFNYDKYKKGRNAGTNVRLRSGDVVMVP